MPATQPAIRGVNRPRPIRAEAKSDAIRVRSERPLAGSLLAAKPLMETNTKTRWALAALVAASMFGLGLSGCGTAEDEVPSEGTLDGKADEGRGSIAQLPTDKLAVPASIIKFQ